MQIRALPSHFKAAAAEWSEDKASRHAASLSYYTVFSIAPLLIIAIAVAGFVFGEEAARNQVVTEIGGLIGEEGARAIQAMIEGAAKPKAGIIATLVGVVALLFGASGVFGQLQDSLNAMWEVRPKPGKGVIGFLKSRFLSFSMVLVIAFILLVSLVLSAAFAAFAKYLGGFLPEYALLARAVDLLVSFGAVMVLFALIFKVLPDAKIEWGDVWTGAAVTALLFSIGRYLIGLFLGHSAVGSAYGAAGSLVVLLLWVYYSSQILFFGAEFTQVYAKHQGSQVVPEEDAEAVTKPAPVKGQAVLEPASAKAADPDRTASRGAAESLAGERGKGGGESGQPEGGKRLAEAPMALTVLRRRRRLGAGALAVSLAFIAASAAARGAAGFLRRPRRA